MKVQNTKIFNCYSAKFRKDETVSCRLTTEQKEWLQKRAIKENQTISNILNRIIKEYLEREGK